MYNTCLPAEPLMPGPISQLFYDGLPSRNQVQYPALAASDASALQPLIPPPTPVPTEVSTPTELGEFASNVVYQMWYVKTTGSTLVDQVPPQSPLPSQPANLSQTASSQFKNFCVQVLLQTQLSNTVVILSLKYVQRFVKGGRPVDFGEEGPEYRLFTIALMLANKFLDDNTFTNKTWSEVTSIPVKEINKMELAFLECMDFKMFVSGSDYSHWLDCLKEYTKTQQQLYIHQRQRSSDALNNGSLITAQIQNQSDSVRPTRKSMQFNQDSTSYFDPNVTVPIVGQCMMPVNQLSNGMTFSLPTSIRSNVNGIVQSSVPARIQHSFGRNSSSPAFQALHNSFFNPLRNSENANGEVGPFNHTKRHSMPAMNLQNIIDQTPLQQTSQFKPVNSNPHAYHLATVKMEANQINPSSVNTSYHNNSASRVDVIGQFDNSDVYGSYGNVGVSDQRGEQPHVNFPVPIVGNLDNVNSIAHHKPLTQLFNTKTIATHYPNVNENVTDNLHSFIKPQQQKVTTEVHENEQQLTHRRSMPQLVRSAYTSSLGYAGMMSQAEDGYNSTAIQSGVAHIHSPEQHHSTPPLMYHQKDLGSRAAQHKVGSLAPFSMGVSSNPPTPVDLPSNLMIQPYRSIIGSNYNNAHNSAHSQKSGQYYGSVQAQQGMNIVDGIGGFVFPLFGSNGSSNNDSTVQPYSVKRSEEGIVNKNHGVIGPIAPVMIAPPGLGVVGGFGPPAMTVQTSREHLPTTASNKVVGSAVSNISSGGYYRMFDGITIA
ncbi:8468_t:CDS:2 [Acaulospora morrowiae]|uniref:8468_t:CDS:1 n=1 Tax=Acaulospora morrowiae TaxID=94023 RepID=A0A9N9H1D2_9GLOM|nr:8468_t:CDS:2 [Acaulospora morrowiae]